jgi:hypothetical protein
VRIGGLAGRDRFKELDERKFSTSAGAVDVELQLDPVRGILAQLIAELRGPIAAAFSIEFEDPDRHQVVE